MTEEMSSYETFPSNTTKVSVCTSANVINVQGFIDKLQEKYPHLDIQYYELPYNDIDNFKFKGGDVSIMILCHSINNRRFALTDVMDALYDKFLANSANILGKDRICVIAHDFPQDKGLDRPDKYQAEMDIFDSRQPTTFKKSGLVIMCGKLEGPVELQESNWDALKKFLEKAASSPLPNSGQGCWEQIVDMLEKCPKWLLAFIVVMIVVLGLAIGLGVGIGDKSPSPGSVTDVMMANGSTLTSSTIPKTISPEGATPPPTTVPPGATPPTPAG